jgi:aspartyl-tRNA(Asn)/glutamyl-tRNA(Gln) amidotransferase subunit B
MEFESIIGLEIHVQLKTKTKMFCRCKVVDINSQANSSICPICSGQPGALPLPNKEAVIMAIKIGHSLNMKINRFSIFARKNYFYPDLPKGYQISQYELPLCENGFIDIGNKKIRIKRVHLEEDAAKSLHSIGSEKLDYSLIDFNRCGVPLVEIVSEPDIRTPDEAYEYLVKLKKILRWIDVSNCDMEKGELRCDVNVSIREKGIDKFGTKVEIKNLNSFKAVKDALNYEIQRQIYLKKRNQPIEHETRLWNEAKGETFVMRTKEEATDYRYFPEPDLLPLVLDEKMIDDIKESIGKLYDDIKKEYISRYSLKEEEIETIVSNKHLYNYFERVIKNSNNREIVKNAINIINTQVLYYINQNKIDETEYFEKLPQPLYIYEIADLMSKNIISATAAKKIFDEMIKTNERPAVLVDKLNLRQTNDINEIENIIKQAISANPKAFEDFKKGNEKASGPIVGYVMKQTKGRANPQIVMEILKKLKE